MRTTSDLLAASVAENATWCSLVSRSHGIDTERTVRWTRTRTGAPRFYPDVITLDPALTATEVADLLSARVACSVKDSFGCLDLSPHGFELLFEAYWLALDSKTARPSPRYRWRVVSDTSTFATFSALHDSQSPLREALIDEPETRLWLLDDAPAPAGFVAHRTADVVAVSNSFGGLEPDELWTETIALADRGWDSPTTGLQTVAYESGDDLSAALAVGFVTLGPLRVWVRHG